MADMCNCKEKPQEHRSGIVEERGFTWMSCAMQLKPAGAQIWD